MRKRAAAIRRMHKQSLLLSRAGVVNRLKAAPNERYRALLQCELEYLDAQLLEWDADVGEEGKPVIISFADDVPSGARLK